MNSLPREVVQNLCPARHFCQPLNGGIVTGLYRLFLTSVLLMVTAYQLQAQTSTTYDSVLANRLGADRIGMKKYVIAFLKRGPNRSQHSTEATRLQAAHMANIQRMAREGTLVLAGPFLDDGELRGIYIFNVSTVDSARALTETDPAVKSGRLAMELHPWYGSAALMEVTRIHAMLQRP